MGGVPPSGAVLGRRTAFGKITAQHLFAPALRAGRQWGRFFEFAFLQVENAVGGCGEDAKNAGNCDEKYGDGKENGAEYF